MSIRRPLVILPLLWALSCNAGGGDGWVKGRLWVENCRDGEPLGQAPSKPADFDLGADFFAGETHEDSNESPSQRRNGLSIRVQDTSNNIEDSNGVALQLLDLRSIARIMVKGEPVPITYRVGCTGSACSGKDDLIRARLYLYAICPNCHQPMVASSQQVKLLPDDTGAGSSASGCLLPSSTSLPACPTLDATRKQELDALCIGEGARDSAFSTQVDTLLGTGTCLYLCRLGSAQRGQDPSTLDNFRIDYGDRVTGVFSFSVIDGRSLQQNTCGQVLGVVQGMFDFEVARGRVAQSFP